jgi:hypothetical protein
MIFKELHDTLENRLNVDYVNVMSLIMLLPPLERIEKSSLNMVTNYDKSFLFHAVKNNDIKAIEYLSTHNGWSAVNSRGQNIWHYIVDEGTIDLFNSSIEIYHGLIYNKLVNKEISLNRIDKFGNSPLDLSLIKNRLNLSIRICQEKDLIDISIIRRSMIKFPTNDWIETIMKHKLLTPDQMNFTFDSCNGHNILYKMVLDNEYNIIEKMILYGIALNVNIYKGTTMKQLLNLKSVNRLTKQLIENNLYLIYGNNIIPRKQFKDVLLV